MSSMTREIEKALHKNSTKKAHNQCQTYTVDKTTLISIGPGINLRLSGGIVFNK